MWKRVIVGILAIMAMTMPSVGLTEGLITLFYTNADSVYAELSATGTTATCSGYIKATSSANSVSITVKLKRKSGTSWVTVKTWTGSGKGKVSVGKTHTLEKKNQYRVDVTGTIKNANGDLLESLSKQSKTIST